MKRLPTLPWTEQLHFKMLGSNLSTPNSGPTGIPAFQFTAPQRSAIVAGPHAADPRFRMQYVLQESL